MCFNLKQQLNILHLMSCNSGSNSKADVWVDLEVGDHVIDIRVAQFLLTPDSPSVTDSPEIDELRQEVHIIKRASSC